MEAGFSMGSNIGDRQDFLHRALLALTEGGDVEILAKSRLYETRPVDVRDCYKNMAFLNVVVILESVRTPLEWLARIQEIETGMWRRRGLHANDPRTIDIDIIYTGNLVISQENLVIPHPRWQEREFVVRPLADARPDLKLPGAKMTVQELLETFGGSENAILVSKDW
ncbi:MAG TPA: 2-amino-4-hydroxy-6-hydroxymethyldihydropteridine diphosphokinase [Kiritimatiellia bacterium]|nr:2-amino-4-hydroxy-6-hydroxymethyldihydropteridine diphosphokinase [Kiritimatiellia bacterium]HNS79881.1 2-amino-4-hydroxy-6-hydroxymethyldihydropteridine diphosphokinase [Kiritimatiellia bacterium]HPA78448.1 2-amino-4-hydroxy-6-hydroxymethyldihydropteridine diphosphokinase [Kiritimatiellia bacterium]